MKKEQVNIGQVYSAKVTDKVVPVRIEKERPASGGGGWDAVNLHTNRPVRIKSAQRLRGRVTVPGADAGAPAKTPAKKKLTKKELAARRAHLKAQHKADQENARLRDEREASPDGMTASERAMAESDKDQPKAATTQRKPRKKRDGMSCLDAAARVLEEAGEPMNTKAMVEAMVARGYWSTDAPTPAATLYSAILREIQKKGDQARFTKVERGRFALTPGRPGRPESAAASEGKEG